MQLGYPRQNMGAPLGEGDKLAHALPWPQALANFLEDPAEALCRLKSLETQHRIVALLDTPMILLDGIGGATDLLVLDR